VYQAGEGCTEALTLLEVLVLVKENTSRSNCSILSVYQTNQVEHIYAVSAGQHTSPRSGTSMGDKRNSKRACGRCEWPSLATLGGFMMRGVAVDKMTGHLS
jgi:hypothetical protein